MKKLIIKMTDTMYEKIVNYEVDAPTQMIESIRHGIVLPSNLTNGDMVLSLFPIPDVIREQANHKVLERFNFYKLDIDIAGGISHIISKMTK